MVLSCRKSSYSVVIHEQDESLKGWCKKETHKEAGVIDAFPQAPRQAAIQVLNGALLQNGLLTLNCNLLAHALQFRQHTEQPQISPQGLMR
jgi:hypothetical protein